MTPMLTEMRILTGMLPAALLLVVAASDAQ